MTSFLVSKFIKDYEKTEDPQVRLRYGFLSGIVGIACNLLLFLLKIALGFYTQSIAVIADAFNNLSDLGSSVATIIGFKMTGKPADKEHPFGHGRSEYITALFVALMVVFVGIQFVRSSIDRIINPKPLVWNTLGIVILSSTVLVKLWMAGFNKALGRRIGSMAMEATSFDSLSDVLITGLVVFSLILSRFIPLAIDGYIGLAVALFILYSGYNITKETLNPLLGEANDEELARKIEERLHNEKGILGSHDLLLHNYGAGRCIATVHAEVSDQLSLVEAHRIIDHAERLISQELNLELVIHLDPINITDRHVLEMEKSCKAILYNVNQQLDMHDFMVIEETERERISFDMTLPFCWNKEEEDQALKAVEEHLEKKYPGIYRTIRLDRK